MKQRPILCCMDAVGDAQDLHYAAHGPEMQLIFSYFDFKYRARTPIESDDDYLDVGAVFDSTGEEALIDHKDGLELLKNCWEVTRERGEKDSDLLLVKAVDSGGRLK